MVIAAMIFVSVLFVLTLILTRFLHGSVINPIKKIGTVCSLVTRGDFDARVDISNRDEIGVLGDTINEMVQGLYERFQLSKFVSSSTIASIQNREKGAKALMTLFFSDIRSFTSFAENKLPEEVVESLNRVLNVQTEIIHRNGGDVDKYVGDEVVALFSGDDQAQKACRSALEIQHELSKASTEQYAGLEVGIGINTGEIILGMIGSEQRADYTVIGDHVNLAARLCDAARPGTVLISDSTYRNIAERAGVSKPYSIKVKGKERPQKVYLLKALRVKKR